MTLAPEPPRTAPAPSAGPGPATPDGPAPRTVLPGRAAGPAGLSGLSGEERRSLAATRPSDRFALVGAAAAALAVTGLLFGRMLPFDGAVGFAVVAYVLFLGLYALLVSFDEDGPTIRDRLAGVLVRTMGLILLVALAFVIVFTLWRGRDALPHTNFFTQDMQLAGPLDGLGVGGVLHAIVGTLQQITLALAVTVPAGLVCAVFLNEVPGRFAGFVRTIVEAMTALPSIVAGLFVYATVILALGFDKSGLAASLALAVMMLPIIIRAADVVIRLVPGNLREASYALGTSRWRTVWHVVLPTARSGLTTSVILGTARGVGETSPVLLTAGFTAELNADPLSGPQVSLPLATFEFVKSPEPDMIARGFGTAATLMALVLLLFVIARIVGGRDPGRLTKGQTHRRVLASRRDAARFEARAAVRTTPSEPPADTTPRSTP
ncbi:phosphate ABC transporter permease PstA [Streptomyces sp. NBC_00059]|uniref:phosphate ABC transporter permease PstA n=1 Tax=Streptomyces sp. NBC_00059 TaxID=2975635 RepID=UPI00225A6BD7|nr:phosphate ABC transporter permease PstA [Streptomyces sp. NBC_00059]MCX5410514.1 phosphate ABC transporter permease PstA [Streptomyces sp. NBC_00059]